MIYSMTGFAAASVDLEAGSLSMEIRSVNHRYLDIQLRMPDELRQLESALREAIAGQLSRGKVDCRINFAARTAGSLTAELNTTLLQQLAQWSNTVRTVFPNARELSVADVLRWNGMLEAPGLSADNLRASSLALLQQLLQEYSASREREGARLRDFLLQRVAQIDALREAVAPRIPAAIQAHEEKLRQRLLEVLGSQDNERLHQELALFAGKIDVDEELSRLHTHLAEMRRVLDKGGAVGKRLDFLMQELHREANTLGSKSVDAEVSRTSMEMKILIEQMREQIQNLE
ncbi:MAG TPA: YicC/YloC family endoribonuclease [Gallionellaceae bacterium]|nr:YicC/YloC family endoribonuclease [Gallionellaceae bacterium]